MGVNSAMDSSSGASYSMRVGRPKAVIRAEETSGELYRCGGGGGSSSLLLLLLLLLEKVL